MFAKKIGIDLGTSTVQVYVRGEGIVIDEPALVAVRRGTSEILAVGRQAAELCEQSPERVEVRRPVRDGGVADLAAAEGMLRHLIVRAQGRQRLFRPEVMICVPADATGDQRRALAEAAIMAGARQAWLIDAPLAAAMGIGLSIGEALPHAMCDIGAGSTQVAVIAFSGLVVAHAVPVGGVHLDAAIAADVRARHDVVIEERTAETAKLAVGSALRLPEPVTWQVRGRDVPSGRPRAVTITSDQLTESMEGSLTSIAEAVRQGLAQTPRRLAAHLPARGLVLTGGGALLRGLDRYMERETGLPARVADDPRTCVVRGTRRALGQFEILQRRQLYLR
jgi:rod shape-determining protein MreB